MWRTIEVCEKFKLLNSARQALTKELRRPNSSTSGQFLSKVAVRNVPRLDLGRAIGEAEKLVQYEVSFQSLRHLLNDENQIVGLRDRIGNDHPLHKTINNLLYDEQKFPEFGMMVLLVAKTCDSHAANSATVDRDERTGVLQSQRSLAEAIDMCRLAHRVHQTIVNLQSLDERGDGPSDNSVASAITFGNKVALLGGDGLLARAFHQVSTIRNQDLLFLISSALRDLTESSFIGERDDQNNPLPGKPHPYAVDSTGDVHDFNDFNFGDLDDNTAPLRYDGCFGCAAKEWSLRNVLGGASLLAKGCQGAILLGRHPEPLQKRVYLLGKHLALAWQARLDLQPFLSVPLSYRGNATQVDLVSAPVLFHLEHDATLYEEIEKGCQSVHNIDHFKLHQLVAQGPGMERTKVLQLKHSVLAMEILNEMPLSDARVTLENMIRAMQIL